MLVWEAGTFNALHQPSSREAVTICCDNANISERFLHYDSKDKPTVHPVLIGAVIYRLLHISDVGFGVATGRKGGLLY